MRRTDSVWQGASVANAYLEGVRAAIPLAGEQVDVMLRLLAGCGRPILRILDLGCGDGVLGDAVLRRFPGAMADLADFSEPMLDAARRRFSSRAAAVHFIVADYGIPSWTEPFAGASYDAIVSGYSIHHQPDARKSELYRELFHLLNPGGMFVNVEHVAPASPWGGALNDELFIDHLHERDLDRPRSDVAQAYRDRPDRAANILAPVESQCQWLRETGFEDVDCYLKIFELAVFGGRKPTPKSPSTGGTPARSANRPR